MEVGHSSLKFKFLQESECKSFDKTSTYQLKKTKLRKRI